jgi:hypothetical protein
MMSSRMPILSGRRLNVLGISKVDKACELVEALVHANTLKPTPTREAFQSLVGTG